MTREDSRGRSGLPGCSLVEGTVLPEVRGREGWETLMSFIGNMRNSGEYRGWRGEDERRAQQILTINFVFNPFCSSFQLVTLVSTRYTAHDWLHNMATISSSTVLKQIAVPVYSCFLWGVTVSVVHRWLLWHNWIRGAKWADHMLITKTPHSLLGSALGLLLVFRTNTAYSRFWEGRKIWEHVTNLSRDTSRMVRLYRREMGAAKVERCLGLLAAFPFLLRQRVQPRWLIEKVKKDKRFSKYAEEGEGGGIEEENDEGGLGFSWVDKRKTPWKLMPKGSLEPCVASQNRPLWICDRLGSEFVSIKDSETFTNRER